jgi:hypothetical protein
VLVETTQLKAQQVRFTIEATLAHGPEPRADRVRHGARDFARHLRHRQHALMQDDLLLYYERELTYLRKLGAEFAQKYPEGGLALCNSRRARRRPARRTTCLKASRFLTGASCNGALTTTSRKSRRTLLEDAASAARASDSVDVHRRHAARSGAGQVAGGFQRARAAARCTSRPVHGVPLQLPHHVRHRRCGR